MILISECYREKGRKVYMAL